jgi:hypothetical protein
MLETSEERIKMLKTGFTEKQIEQMYVESNNFKIVSLPIPVELVKIGYEQNKKCENAVGSGQSFGLAIASIFNTSRFGRSSPTIQ